MIVIVYFLLGADVVGPFKDEEEAKTHLKNEGCFQPNPNFPNYWAYQVGSQTHKDAWIVTVESPESWLSKE
jgi:hypothetical protein